MRRPKKQGLAARSSRATRVGTTASLVEALRHADDGATILLANGIYTPPPDLLITHHKVTLRGASGDREKVVLDAGGKFSTMLRIKGARETLIADMTFRNCQHYGIFIFGDSGVRGTRIENVKFHNIWTRSVKGTHPQRPDDNPEPLLPMARAHKLRPRDGEIKNCLFVCDTKKPYDDLFGGDYISGIDMMMLKDWHISGNVFQGIRGKNGGGRGAVFLWVGCEDVIVEDNLIANCDRGICFGNPSGTAPQVTRGIVRHNRIVAGADKAIELCGTVKCEIAHNSVHATNFEFPKTVHVFCGSRGTRMHHNIIHGHLALEDKTACERNVVGRLEGVFTDPEAGDLRLTAKAKRDVGKGTAGY